MTRTIEELKQENGVRCMMMLEDGIPMYYPTLFVSVELRHFSVSRQRNMLYCIEVLFNWCQSEHIDLEELFKRGDHLSENEILRLLDFCSWTVNTQLRVVEGVKLLPSAYEQVSKETAAQRIQAIRSYLNFLYLRLAKRKDKADIARSATQTIKSYKPKLKRHTKNKSVSLSEEQINVIIEKLLPSHPSNPWRDPEIQLRNLLIFSVFYETGMRRGELAGLYVGDVKGAEISIYRRHNNPLETRKQAPSAKTGERTIPIPDHLALLIDEYVLNHRGLIKAAKKHPYLFVSHGRNKGAPLSLNAITEVFKVARKAYPALKDITPHDLRHHMNYRISMMIDNEYKDALPADKAIADQEVRSYLMGWSPDGKMQETYNKRYSIEKAGEMLVKRSNKLSKKEDDASKKT